MATQSTPSARPPRGARSAKQERSRETLARILAAAEELLEMREFDELTMADLAERARCGVGTVYGRLPNKESLLLCLHERSMEAGLAGSARVFERCRDADLETRVRALCALIVDFFSTHRGVTRAITNYLFARPSRGVGAEVKKLRRDSMAGFKQAAAFLAERVDRRVHAAPQVACEFGLLAVIDVVEGRVVFGDRSRVRIDYSSKALKARVSALLLAYLEHPGSAR